MRKAAAVLKRESSLPIPSYALATRPLFTPLPPCVSRAPWARADAPLAASCPRGVDTPNFSPAYRPTCFPQTPDANALVQGQLLYKDRHGALHSGTELFSSPWSCVTDWRWQRQVFAWLPVALESLELVMVLYAFGCFITNVLLHHFYSFN